MKGPLFIIALVAGGLWWFTRKGGAAVVMGADGKPIAEGTGKNPLSIGRVGSDITTNDTRGDAIAKGINALLGDPYSQGTVTYEDADIGLTFTKGMDVSGQIFGPRMTSPSQGAMSGSQPGAEATLVNFYRSLSLSPDPAARREAWLFSWTQPFSDLYDWLDKLRITRNARA